MINIDYYNPKRMLSFRKPYRFSLGNRSIGKTFAYKCYMVNRWLKKQRKFVVLKRYKDEFDDENFKKFFEDIAFKFPDVEFEVKGRYLFINGEQAGICLSLNGSQRVKGGTMVQYDTIFFDEFLPEDGKYLKEEVTKLQSMYFSIARGDGAFYRPEVFVIMVANTVTLNNPYFVEFGIYSDGCAGYKSGTGWVLEITFKEEIANAILNSEAGQLASQTGYGAYAFGTRFMLDNDLYIKQMSGGCKYICTLGYYGRQWAVYLNESQGCYYVNDKVDKCYPLRFAFTTDSHQPNFVMMVSYRRSQQLKQLVYAYSIGRVYFQNQKCKADFYELNKIAT